MRPTIRRSALASLIGLAAIALTATSTLAYSPYGLVSDFTTTPADGSPGTTYYDVYNGAETGRGDLNEQLLFYRDVVVNRDNLTHWSNLG